MSDSHPALEAGKKNLHDLLSSLSPELGQEEYVFVVLKDASEVRSLDVQPKATFVEQEGLTLVLTRAQADGLGMEYAAVFRCITLTVHSSLEAVGLTAAFATRLAEHGISANVMAGYFHDHIFVQSRDADVALAALQSLQSQTN